MDVDSLLKDAQAQKTKASGLRKRGNVDEAREILLDVIDDLEHVAQEASDTFYTSKEWLPVRKVFADTLGMVGGLERRLKHYPESLSWYRKGLKIEDLDKVSTYNFGNEIVLTILSEESRLESPTVQTALDDLIDRLRKAIDNSNDAKMAAAVRTEQWWAWSDLGQAYLLKGMFDEALSAYEKGIRETNPSEGDRQSSKNVLVELGDDLATLSPEISRSLHAQAARLA